MTESKEEVEKKGEVNLRERNVADSSKKVDTLEKNFEDLGKEITCAICHVHYTDPKVLPCCHYYCKECIRKLSLDNTNKPFLCPECRKDITLPEGGVDQLPTAFFINRMKTMHSNMERAHGKVEAKCQMCSRDKAEAFCLQCAMFICAECVKHHQILKVFTGHRIVTLGELKEGEAKDILPEPTLKPCPAHKELLKIYCYDCKCLICRDCTIKDHHGHNYEFITVAAPQIKKKLIEQLDPVREANANLSQAIETIELTVSEIEKQKISVDESITTSFEELRSIIDAREKELLKETEATVKEKVDCLSNQKKQLSISRAVVQSVIDYTEQCVEHSADDEVMGMYTELESRIDKEIKDQITDLEPLEHADIGVAVSFAQDLEKLCQTKARMVLDYTVVKSEEIKSEVYEVSEVDVTIKLPNGKPIRKTQAIKCQLKSLANDFITECEVTPLDHDENEATATKDSEPESAPAKGHEPDTAPEATPMENGELEATPVERGRYRIKYMPTIRGRHDLTVIVNDHEISTAPFRVFVSIPPDKMKNAVQAIDNPYAAKSINTPYDIALTSSGEVIIATNTYIAKLDGGKRRRKYQREYQREYQRQAIAKLDGGKRRTRYQCKAGEKFIGVTVDTTNDNVYAVTYVSSHNEIIQLDPDLTVVQNTTKINEENGCCDISGIELFGDEVIVFNSDTKNMKVYTKGLDPVEPVEPVKPIAISSSGVYDVSSDKDGNLYVADYSYGNIRVFNKASGELLRSFSGSVYSLGVCVYGEYVFVSNNSNYCINVYKIDGKSVTTLSGSGSGVNNLSCPRGLCVDADGFLYVCDRSNNRIQVF